MLDCILAVLVPCGPLLADDKKEEKIAAELVGKWKLNDGKNNADYDEEFMKDGKMSLVSAVLDKARHELKFRGTYTVEDSKVLTKVVGKGMVDPRDWVINTLTDVELFVTEIGDTNPMKLVRIKGK